MTQNLLDKALDLINARAHGWFDNQLNTVEGFQEAIRKAERDLATIKAGHVQAVAFIVGYDRKLNELATSIEQKNADADLLLTRGMTSQAESIESELAGLMDTQKTLEEAKADMVTRRDKIAQVIEARDKELTKAKADRDRLMVSKDAADAVSSTTGSLGSFGPSGLGSRDFDRIRDKLQHQVDVADAELDAAIQGSSSQPSPSEVAADLRVQSALDARRERLGLPKQSDDTPSS